MSVAFRKVANLYVIRNWERDFENAKSRTIERTSCFYMPNSFDGKRIRRLQALPNPAELYGAFIAIAAVASRCWWRGVLLDRDDGPLTAQELADITGLPSEPFARALNELSKPMVGLLEKYQIEQNTAGEWPLPDAVRQWAVPQNTRRSSQPRNHAPESNESFPSVQVKLNGHRSRI